MSDDKVQGIIFAALAAANAERSAGERFAISEDTRLFGENAVLDSLSLVSVIVDVETALRDEFGVPLSLTDDRAVSRPVSPFTDVRSLHAYIAELLAETK
jgi:acyl carrier protein